MDFLSFVLVLFLMNAKKERFGIAQQRKGALGLRGSGSIICVCELKVALFVIAYSVHCGLEFS